MADGRWYGEKIVCTAQTLGLNTCWVAMTYWQISGTAACFGGTSFPTCFVPTNSMYAPYRLRFSQSQTKKSVPPRCANGIGAVILDVWKGTDQKVTVSGTPASSGQV